WSRLAVVSAYSGTQAPVVVRYSTSVDTIAQRSEGDQTRHGPGRDESSLRDGIQHRGWQRDQEGLGRQITVRTRVDTPRPYTHHGLSPTVGPITRSSCAAMRKRPPDRNPEAVIRCARRGT